MRNLRIFTTEYAEFHGVLRRFWCFSTFGSVAVKLSALRGFILLETDTFL
jgi:hypothetical protein